MNDLGDDLNRAAGPPEPNLDMAGLTARARSRAVTRRRSLMGVSVAALLLVGGVAFSATRHDDRPSQLVTASDGDGTSAPDGSSTSVDPSNTADPTTTVDDTAPPPASTPTDPVDSTTSLVAPAPTTTVVTPPSTPPTTAPPAGVTSLRVSGTYTGHEEYRFNTSGCATPGMDLSHLLESTLTPTHDYDGTADPGAWTYKSNYCSKVTGSTWAGSGTFAIGLPGGETLWGTVHDSTAYPTSGEPYQVQIDSGTGKYEGATGVCEFTVHITDKALGSQTQSGDFKCEVTTGGGSATSDSGQSGSVQFVPGRG